jgi:hypothetical protein
VVQKVIVGITVLAVEQRWTVMKMQKSIEERLTQDDATEEMMDANYFCIGTKLNRIEIMKEELDE